MKARSYVHRNTMSALTWVNNHTGNPRLRLAHFSSQTGGCGLSLADRAGLALALDKYLPVLRIEPAWQRLKLKVKIQVAR